MPGKNAPRPCWPCPKSGLLLGMNDVICDATAWRRWLVSLLRRLGVDVSYPAFCRGWERQYAQDVCCGRREMIEAFREMLRSLGLPRAQIDEVVSACRAHWRQTDNATRALPGVRTTLARLREAGVVLGVLTDSGCGKAAISERLDRFGLAGFFASVLSSFDLGQTKPCPMGYARSLRAMGLDAADVAFVGHRAAELAGAAALGMGTIALNYDEDVQADVCVGRFDELLSLAAMQPRRAAAG
ncbi:MAG: HAD family hydrolase [Pirellulales bacterium]|nr:HAD family hydrolase [Pirellulales bacterium]